MTIKEVCARYDITADTLRYYEKAGVIPEVHRTNSGIRDYTDEDIGWVETAICFRNAGMPVDKLAEYVRLFKEGDHTIGARLELLKGVQTEILEEKRRCEEALTRLDYKIRVYEEAARTGKLNWDKYK